MCLYKGYERDAAGQGGKAASKALVLVQELQKERIKPFFFFFKGGRKISNCECETEEMRGVCGLLDQKEAHSRIQVG